MSSSTFKQTDRHLMNQTAKAEHILDVALELLNTEGDFGVTMRQVATRAGISLSNVQYYFKTKDDLLKALADRYFATCLENINQIKLIQRPDAIREDMETLLREFLQHGLEVSEMCRIFREYWAISTRNEVIDAYIQQYYRDVVASLTEMLRPVAGSEEGLSRALSVLIPYAEGYSIAAKAMPVDMDTVINTLAPTFAELIEEVPSK